METCKFFQKKPVNPRRDLKLKINGFFRTLLIIPFYLAVGYTISGFRNIEINESDYITYISTFVILVFVLISFRHNYREIKEYDKGSFITPYISLEEGRLELVTFYGLKEELLSNEIEMISLNEKSKHILVKTCSYRKNIIVEDIYDYSIYEMFPIFREYLINN